MEVTTELVGLLMMVLGIGIGFNLREIASDRLKARRAMDKRTPRQ